MSDWKDQLSKLEIEPPADAWLQIERKRKWNRWTRWSSFTLLTGLVVYSAYWSLFLQPKVTTSQSQPENYSMQTPALSNPPSLSSKQKENTEILQSEKKKLDNPSFNLAEQSVASAQFPYNGRVVSKQTESSMENTPLTPLEFPSDLSPITPMTEAISVTEDSALSVQEGQSYPSIMEEIEFPNVFTPNGDGWNDEFAPSQHLPAEYNIIQWHLYKNGNLIRIFEKSSTWKGENEFNYTLPAGVYQYIIYYSDTVGKFMTKSGNILLQL